MSTEPGPFKGRTITQLLVVAVIVGCCIGIAFVAAHVAGIVIPSWVITIMWIVLVGVVAVAAIKFLASLI